MTAEDRAIQRDRMRFIKNSLSANLALLGILFNVFYFISICKSDVGTWYYTILIGASIVYNLVFMLAVFLSSEGVKTISRAILTCWPPWACSRLCGFSSSPPGLTPPKPSLTAKPPW